MKMKRPLNIIAIVVLVFLTGCNTLKREFGTHSEPAASSAVPESYEVTGVTALDFQWIQPVRCADSLIRAYVKTPGSSNFRELNRYEFKIDTTGTGGGGVLFGRVCYPTFDAKGNLITLRITQIPVAPRGTEYRIESTLVSGSLY